MATTVHVEEEGSPINGHGDDGYNYNAYNFEFTEKSIRLGFIRKVYAILMCQLAVTIAFICVFIFVEPVQQFSQENTWLWAVAFVMTFVLLIVLACCPEVRRKWPLNFVMLGLFTLCESFLLGSIASRYAPEVVLMAVGITAVVSLALTIFAFQTKWDFTMCSGGLLVLLIILLCFGLLAAIIRNHYLNMVYAAIGALVFSMYLVFDTQLMLGGKHKYSLSPEEYIFAALNLYLDIINMFLFILALAGGSRS